MSSYNYHPYLPLAYITLVTLRDRFRGKFLLLE